MIPATEFSISPARECFHLHLRPEDIADTVILVGDPERVDMFREFCEHIEFEKQAREFHTLTGIFYGKRLTVLSTGIGTDNIDIAVTELDGLANIDFDTHEPRKEHRSLNLLRIGTSGSIQPDLPVGCYVFSHYAIGLDNVLHYYADCPKVCEESIAESFLAQVAWNPKLHQPYAVKCSDSLAAAFEQWAIPGVTLSSSGFYGPQGRSVRTGIAMPHMLDDFENFSWNDTAGKSWRITNFEMESSVLYGLGRILGHNVGTVCSCIGNRHNKATNLDYHSLIRTLVEKSLHTLAAL